MSNKKYPPNVKIKFNQDFEQIPKGFEREFGPATAADFMRKGVAWPSNKDEEAKLPETIAQIKEGEEAAKAKEKKK